MTTINLKGLEDVRDNLKRMDRELRGQVLVDALKEGSHPFERDYIAGAPAVIRRVVRTRVGESLPNRAQVLIGTKHPLVHIFEYGTRRRFNIRWKKKALRKRRATGRITPIGFGRRAFDKNVRPSIGNFGRIVMNKIVQVIR